MNDKEPTLRDNVPTTSRPLLGMTILVVEDSRYASEAMRLMCVRSGARIRRADCLGSARRHLQVYRPTVMIVDLGLPDGSGLDLIAEMGRANPRVDVLLATSGDAALREAALDAGAVGFLEKPVQKLAAFQNAILTQVPEDRRPAGPRPVDPDDVEPDAVAYRDDMAAMADRLEQGADPPTVHYVTQFLRGVARAARDTVLLDAVDALRADQRSGRNTGGGVARVTGLLRDRAARRVSL
ncbi:response regulator [Pseudooceanicola batsensis HTCC2597]|uniref:Response regulator n=1 Tax=Pseudooceanicola batsensis (strain ATCC BAA-863 / DSM 15984 / KCTC 12145 / HTCC2597) TaxID=252305 RepID=A3TTD3_PSEBH|nr:response regulator [Pseudooceanicola batsensis]EAQ04910.1 response regulator [Pseudooceanicola batsensis HTCC2597]